MFQLYVVDAAYGAREIYVHRLKKKETPDCLEKYFIPEEAFSADEKIEVSQLEVFHPYAVLSEGRWKRCRLQARKCTAETYNLIF